MKTKYHKNTLKLNCIITPFIITMLIVDIAFWGPTISDMFINIFNPSYAAIKYLNEYYSLALPTSLQQKYSYSTYDSPDSYYIFDCSSSDGKFLSSYYKKMDAPIVNYFFDKINPFYAITGIEDKDKIFSTDDFLWHYALREDSLPSDFNPTTAEYQEKAVIAVYKPSNNLLYCYHYFFAH